MKRELAARLVHESVFDFNFVAATLGAIKVLSLLERSVYRLSAQRFELICISNHYFSTG